MYVKEEFFDVVCGETSQPDRNAKQLEDFATDVRHGEPYKRCQKYTEPLIWEKNDHHSRNEI